MLFSLFNEKMSYFCFGSHKNGLAYNGTRKKQSSCSFSPKKICYSNCHHYSTLRPESTIQFQINAMDTRCSQSHPAKNDGLRGQNKV